MPAAKKKKKKRRKKKEGRRPRKKLDTCGKIITKDKSTQMQELNEKWLP